MANNYQDTGLKDFAAYVGKVSLQRSNRYEILFNLPSVVLDQLKSVIDDELHDIESSDNKNTLFTPDKVLSLMAQSVSTPGVTILYNEVSLGPHRKIAYDKSTGEFVVVFRCSGNMVERKIFDAWLQIINKKNYTREFYSNYISDVLVKAITPDGKISYQVDISEAYPMTITELSFDRADMNTYMTFSVTFAFKTAKRHPTTFGPSLVTKDNLNFNVKGIKTKYSASSNLNPASLPKPVYNSNMPQQLLDIYRNIEKVKNLIESGEYSATSGRIRLMHLARDLDAIYGSGGDPAIDAAIKYIADLDFLINNRS